jgi:hypothetical protein
VTAQEFIAHLAPLDMNRLALVFDWIADHASELRLNGGQRLLDSIDWSAFLHEAAVAARNSETAIREAALLRPDPKCPDCQHVHEDRQECGHYLGEEKFCRCEAKVTA